MDLSSSHTLTLSQFSQSDRVYVHTFHSSAFRMKPGGVYDSIGFHFRSKVTDSNLKVMYIYIYIYIYICIERERESDIYCTRHFNNMHCILLVPVHVIILCCLASVYAHSPELHGNAEEFRSVQCSSKQFPRVGHLSIHLARLSYRKAKLPVKPLQRR